MTVEISRLDKDYRALATAADRATGRPDGRTSMAEVNAYLDANAVLINREDWSLKRMRAAILLLETDDRLSVTRRAELVRIAADIGKRGQEDRNTNTDELLTQNGVTDPGERQWASGLVAVYSRLSYGVPRALLGVIDEVAADGEISDVDRRRIREAAGDVVKDEVPSANLVADVFAQRVAERRARVFGAVYSDAVRAGLVTGVAAGGPLEPPSATAATAVRDGSLIKQLTAAPRERLPQVLARFERGWPRIGQYDIEGLATELTRDWDKAQPSATSPARLLAALYPSTEHYRYARDNQPLSKADHRAALAAAIVTRLTDAQLARLDGPLVAGLASGLMGGGTVRVARSAIEQQQPNYILPTAVNGPRTFGIHSGEGKKYDAQLTRLRNVTATRFNWRQPPREYYDRPDLELIEGAS